MIKVTGLRLILYLCFVPRPPHLHGAVLGELAASWRSFVGRVFVPAKTRENRLIECMQMQIQYRARTRGLT